MLNFEGCILYGVDCLVYILLWSEKEENELYSYKGLLFCVAISKHKTYLLVNSIQSSPSQK